MDDPAVLIAIASSCLIGLLITIAAALKGWAEWLKLKQLELGRSGRGSTSLPGPAGRIELSDLKDRVRRLEAIAAGADL